MIPVVLDDLSTGHAEAVPSGITLIKGNAGDATLVERVLREFNVGSVLHFAGSVRVEESVRDPLKYYKNNAASTLSLLQACVAAEVRKVVFSSTAAVYGEVEGGPVSEMDATAPISPYGWSKLFAERAMLDLARSVPELGVVILRYFNVAGADPQGRTGQRGRETTHLIRRAIDVVLGRQDVLEVFGSDYPTRDGTCERDFVHVTDLVAAHLLALDYLASGKGGALTLNCGYGRGHTVAEVVQALETISGVRIPTRVMPRRSGDAVSIIADSRRARAMLGWSPKHDSLESILRSALAWEGYSQVGPTPSAPDAPKSF
jgi:UDP-glucose 4-epimerase